MNKNTLTHIITDELKGTKDGDTYTLPEGTRLTVFLAVPGTAMGMNKVTGFSIQDSYVTLHGEETRTFTDLSEIMAVRVDEEATKQHKLGFGS